MYTVNRSTPCGRLFLFFTIAYSIFHQHETFFSLECFSLTGSNNIAPYFNIVEHHFCNNINTSFQYAHIIAKSLAYIQKFPPFLIVFEPLFLKVTQKITFETLNFTGFSHIPSRVQFPSSALFFCVKLRICAILHE